MRLDRGLATDVGRVRNNNEDSLLVSEQLLAVADGMGGHRGGEVASSVALRTLETSFVEPSPDNLVEAAREANAAVFARATEDPELRGMGTTLVAIAPIEGDRLAWINVGDSRLYILRDGELTQISEDHSLVEEAVRSGQLSPEEARIHPQRNIVTRALGIDDDVDVDGGEVEPYVGDRFLLCSDGLYDAVDDSRIASALRRVADPNEAARELVRLANEGGGRDNITVVVADVIDDGDKAATASRQIAGGTAEGHADVAGFTSALPAVEVPEEAPDEEEPKPAKDKKVKAAKPRRVTWRVVAFLLLFLLVLGGAAAAIGWQARHTYYVGFRGDQVTIFKGKPGGVLWFDPTFEADGGLSRADVPASRIDQVTKGHEVGDVEEARRYIDNLRQERSSQTSTTTTTTTTTATTTPPPTTATVPAN